MPCPRIDDNLYSRFTWKQCSLWTKTRIHILPRQKGQRRLGVISVWSCNHITDYPGSKGSTWLLSRIWEVRDDNWKSRCICMEMIMYLPSGLVIISPRGTWFKKEFRAFPIPGWVHWFKQSIAIKPACLMDQCQKLKLELNAHDSRNGLCCCCLVMVVQLILLCVMRHELEIFCFGNWWVNSLTCKKPE